MISDFDLPDKMHCGDAGVERRGSWKVEDGMQGRRIRGAIKYGGVGQSESELSAGTSAALIDQDQSSTACCCTHSTFVSK